MDSRGGDLEFQGADLGPGVRLWVAPTTRFKTTAIAVFLHQELAPPTVTANALVPAVLKRGTRRLPTHQAVARRLDELYGASLWADVSKVGERQVLALGIAVLRDHYVPGPAGGDLLEQACGLLREVLTEPAATGGAFRADYVDQEKEILRRRIEGIINDKAAYAALRATEEMCRGERYALHAAGRLADLPALGPSALFGRYREVLRESPADVYVVGDVDLDEAIRLAPVPPRRDPEAIRVPPPVEIRQAPAAPRRREERQELNQTRVVLGYRTGVTIRDPEYHALLYYNGILGGFSHAKLFRNVREEAGLAYEATSRLDAAKGVLLVTAGVSAGRRAEAVEIIERQVADLREGRVSTLEWEATRLGLINQVRSTQDSALSRIQHHMVFTTHGRQETPAATLCRLRDVTLDDVVAVANHVALDTVYFLTGEEAPA